MSGNDEQLQSPDDAVPQSALGKSADQERIKAPGYLKVYANNIAIRASMWDMSVVFGELIGELNGKPVIEESVSVTLSKEMAKVMANLLTKNVKAYEEKFGVITIPDFSPDDDLVE